MSGRPHLSIPCFLALFTLLAPGRALLAAGPEGLEADPPSAHDIDVAPAPEAAPVADAGRVAEAPRLLMVHLEPVSPEAAPAAGLMAVDLEEALEQHFQVVTLDELPPVLEVPATRYWETCPEKLECLQLLGERAKAATALMGSLYLRQVVRSEIEATESLDTLVVTISLVDILRGEHLPPLTIEIVGEESAPLVEAVTLALEGTPPSLVVAHHPAPPPEPTEDPDRLEDLAPPVRQSSSHHYSRLGGLADPALLRSGHAGQVLFRLSAGAGYGALSQEYYSYQLLMEGNQQIEGFSWLNLAEGAGVGLQLAAGYGLGRHIELEAHFAWSPLSSTLHLYQEQAPLYELDPWTEAECQTGGEGCPDKMAARGSAFSVGLRGRYFPSVERQTRPFLMTGVRWMHAPDVQQDAERSGIEVETWWHDFDPIRSMGVTFGGGIQHDMNRRMGLFFQVPVTWWLQSLSPAPYHQNGGDAYFSDSQLPDTGGRSLPFTFELELGVQLRLN